MGNGLCVCSRVLASEAQGFMRQGATKWIRKKIQETVDLSKHFRVIANLPWGELQFSKELSKLKGLDSNKQMDKEKIQETVDLSKYLCVIVNQPWEDLQFWKELSKKGGSI